MRQFYYDNPEILDIELVDKFSGEHVKGSMPAYFRQRLFPSCSRIISKDVRDCFRLFDYLRGYINSKLIKDGPDFRYFVACSVQEQIIYSKFSCLPRYNDSVESCNVYLSLFGNSYPCITSILHIYSYLSLLLLECPFDVTRYVNQQALKVRHLASVEHDISVKPRIDIQDYAYKLRNDVVRRSYKL